VENNVDYFRPILDKTRFFYLVKTYPFLVVQLTPYFSISVKKISKPAAVWAGLCVLPCAAPRYPQMRFTIS
jgi:hypothetical protein